MAQYTQINPDALVTALTPINNSLGGKQDKTDNTLATTDKTISGAINEINTKVGNLTGALTWKGKFDTLPAVTNYEAGNVVGVGNKEYVLTVTGSTKAWEELGDEGSYLLKSVAEKTYAKKTDIPTIPAIPTVNDPKVSIKMNGAEKGSFTLNQASAGEVDLGTVITTHQDISGKVDKTTLLNTLMVVDLSSDDIAVRKAALDDFKAKWLALGNTDLNGARFIGRFSDSHGNSSIHESGKSLIGEDTLLIYRQVSPSFLQGFYGLSYIKDMANSLCGLYQIYVDYGTTNNPGNIEITQIRDSETFDWLNRFVYGEAPSTYLKITDAESTYAKKTSIPTVNDPKVSIKMNGAEKGSFTLNQASAGEVDLGTVITAHQDISGKVDKTLNAKAFKGITIKTSNTAEAENANKAAIQAYVNNLNMLGVDTTKGFNVPVIIDYNVRNFYGCLTGRYSGEMGDLSGSVFSASGGEYYIKNIYIGPSGHYSELVNIQNDNDLKTTAKDLVGAINEVNTLAKSKGNGTITGVKMNGVSKGTSGVVDLGNVATSIKVDNVSKTPSSGVVNLGYVNKQLITSTASTMTLSPNIYYRNTSTSLSTLTIKLGSIANSNIINEYFVEFTTSSSGTTISLPSAIKWANGETPTFEASTTYQISIVNNLGVVITFK